MYRISLFYIILLYLFAMYYLFICTKIIYACPILFQWSVFFLLIPAQLLLFLLIYFIIISSSLTLSYFCLSFQEYYRISYFEFFKTPVTSLVFQLKKWREMKSLSHVWLFATPWTVACQAPPTIGFSRQEYWSE